MDSRRGTVSGSRGPSLSSSFSRLDSGSSVYSRHIGGGVLHEDVMADRLSRHSTARPFSDRHLALAQHGRPNMNLIFLYGPAASGKLHVGRELSRITGYRLFTITWSSMRSPPSSTSAPVFVRLREEMWLSVFREAARRGVSLIFTFAPETTVRSHSWRTRSRRSREKVATCSSSSSRVRRRSSIGASRTAPAPGSESCARGRSSVSFAIRAPSTTRCRRRDSRSIPPSSVPRTPRFDPGRSCFAPGLHPRRIRRVSCPLLSQ